MNLYRYFSMLSSFSLQTVETSWGYVGERVLIRYTQAGERSGSSTGKRSMDLTIEGPLGAL